MAKVNVVYGYTSTGIKEKCMWDNIAQKRTCPRHVFHADKKNVFSRLFAPVPVFTTTEAENEYEDVYGDAESAGSLAFDGFNGYVNGTLNTIGDMLEDSEYNKFDRKIKAATLNGRGGSELFEKAIIKPAIAERKEEIIATVNAGNNDYTLLDIIDPEEGDESEAAKRAWADIFLQVEKNGVIEDIPVNIKATDSKKPSADNSANWRALAYMMLEPSEASAKVDKEVSMMKLVKEGATDLDSERDYFIWSFSKDSKKPFKGHKSFSLLEVDPTQYTYNRSQSFPLQINADKVKNDGKPLSFSERKNRLFKWILTNNQAYLNDRARLNSEALDSLS